MGNKIPTLSLDTILSAYRQNGYEEINHRVLTLLVDENDVSDLNIAIPLFLKYGYSYEKTSNFAMKSYHLSKNNHFKSDIKPIEYIDKCHESGSPIEWNLLIEIMMTCMSPSYNRLLDAITHAISKNMTIDPALAVAFKV